MDYKKVLRRAALTIAAALLLLVIGCAVAEQAESAENSEPYIVLHILTEASTVDGMKSQIIEMMSVFEAEHKHVNLILDVLPVEGLERQKAISQIYVDIANGEGPDIYLMPNGSTVSVSSSGYLTEEVEPLFADVTEHMYKGTFADISKFYNSDAELDKAGLVESVMDAGLVGNARYTLPLRYSIPVIYGDRAALSDTVLTEAVLNEGINSILREIVNIRDPYLSACVNPLKLHSRYLFNFFTELLDYENCEILIKTRDMSPYLKRAYLVHIWASREEKSPSAPHVGSYISMGDYFASAGFPMTVGSMESALDAAAIAETLGIDLAMIPLRGVGGALIADVTYFGAVGADCAYPETAYEFLRMFLSKDAQWELSRPRSTQGFQSGFIAPGWPVRAEGAAEYLWQNLRFQLGFYVGQDESWKARAEALKQVSLTDEDLDGLLTEPDSARFNNPVESAYLPEYISFSSQDTLGYTTVEEIYYALEAQMDALKEELE